MQFARASRPQVWRTRPRAMRWVATICASMMVPSLLVPALSGASPAHAPQSTVGEPGVGDPYFPLDGNGGIDVSHYDIHTSYDFDSGRLVGRTVLTLEATRDLRRFNLDLLLHATSVRVAGRPAEFRKQGRHELVITPARALRAGKPVTVVVRHRGRPAELTYRGQNNWLANRREVVTVNEPHMAPWWFAANDHPSDKATFSIAVTVPRGRDVISNGRLAKRSVGKRATTWHWRSRDEMATYLAFFAAGDFDVERGRTQGLPWVNAVSEHLPTWRQRQVKRQLRRSPDLVRWLEKHLGPYPFESTGGVVISLDPRFALENQTRPVYPGAWGPDTSLLIHELAHQWFGNSVSVSRWSDIFINEGLATFMEWRRAEAEGLADSHDLMRSHYDWYSSSSSFWKVLPDDPGSEDLFHESVYYRGAMTVQALRTRIGNADFARLLKNWTAVHAGGNASTQEFETMAAEVSGENLDDFFDVWLRTPRKPAATVSNGILRP